jgi:DNA primase
LYSRGLDRSRLWNHAALEQDDGAPVLVVEGVLDAVPYWPDAVATLGKLTHAQSASLRATSRSVVFVPDGDAWMDGRAAAMELRLRGKTAGWVKLPPRIDPDQVDREWLRAAARESLEAAL